MFQRYIEIFQSFVSPQTWSVILVQFGLIYVHKVSYLCVLEVLGSMSSYLLYGLVEQATAVTFWGNEVSNCANLDGFVAALRIYLLVPDVFVLEE